MTEIQHSRRQEHQKCQKSEISNTTRMCTLLTHPPDATLVRLHGLNDHCTSIYGVLWARGS